MKHLKSKKIIVTLLIVVTLFNFILPTVSEAKSRVVDEIAGGLYLGICKLLRHVGDLILGYLQETFIGEEFGVDKIGNFVVTTNKGTPRIMYSPGVIFSGKVPVFDINFFNPGESLDVKKKEQVIHAYSYDYASVVEKAIPIILNHLGYTAGIDKDINTKINLINNDLGTVEPEKKGGFPYEYSDEYELDGKEYMLVESATSCHYYFVFAPTDCWNKVNDCDTQDDVEKLKIDGFAYKSTTSRNTVLDYNSKNGHYTSKADNSEVNAMKKDFDAKIRAYFGGANEEVSEAEKELKALFDQKEDEIGNNGAQQTVSFDFRGTDIFINYEADRGYDRSHGWIFSLAYLH